MIFILKTGISVLWPHDSHTSFFSLSLFSEKQHKISVTWLHFSHLYAYVGILKKRKYADLNYLF